MDSLTFDGYASYSDASTPRTPSPTDMHFNTPQKHDIDHTIPALFADDDSCSAPVVVHPDGSYWPPTSASSFNFSNANSTRGSLLQELYEPESLTPEFQPQETTFQQQQQHADWDPHGQQQHHRPGEFAMMRRATFPYVRHDRDDGAMPLQQYPPFMPSQQHHHQIHHQNGHLMHHHQQENLLPAYSRQDSMDAAYGPDSFSMSSSPHSSYNEFDDGTNIKLEDNSSSMIVPSHPQQQQQQQNFYRPHSNSSAGIAGHPSHPHHPHHSNHPSHLSHHPNHHHNAHHTTNLPISYVSPHTGLPVQHTDDAASKETQYLRRRCFNCHTTEPPSWRRSTLNPGKIVCNKCGLYERTHLRPRPLRFDELRAGNKARKASKGQLGVNGAGGVNGGVSPKQGKLLVKKEPREREFGPSGLVRRSSVSSSASSVHSGSGASDWDDNVSIYSSGSAPPTSFNSPVTHSFPLSRDSQSPPRDGGIRLPKNPLSDIASMHSSPMHSASPMQHPQGLSPQLLPNQTLSLSPHHPNQTLSLSPHHPSQSTTPLLPPRKAHSSPGAFGAGVNGCYSPSLNASPMPSVAENAVWSAEPEEQGGQEQAQSKAGSPASS
ncbi:unnamed protein product [Cyclocybe aegerita]|uniref:GATA-type domain-containing protein n=1 Tax=Cyclocybe aegerita TaxID=1973307 RepID=A0A8S0WC02_CYCAE|nr:unnamed protein product [Cyclocybe aegerita]